VAARRPLSSLPLHAAGGALERVTSSYALDLRTLRSAAARPLSPEPKLLVVAMPETPGERPLPGVLDEVSWLRDRYTATPVVGPAATRANVLAALPDVELACHSSSGRSGQILLADHRTAPLTLLDVAAFASGTPDSPTCRLARLPRRTCPTKPFTWPRRSITPDSLE
jgi:hypothetical protein